MSERILDTVLKYLGQIYGDIDDEVQKLTNTQVAISIDDSIGILVQNAIGHSVSVFRDNDVTWDDFFYGHLDDAAKKSEKKKDISFAQNFICKRALLAFDPPQPTVIALIKEGITEDLYRARLEFDIE